MAASSNEKQTGKEKITSEVKETNFSSNTDVVEEPESLIAKQKMSDAEDKIPEENSEGEISGTNSEDKVSGTNSEGEISAIDSDVKETSKSVESHNNSTIESPKNFSDTSDSDKEQGTVEKVTESYKNLWVRGLSEKTRAVDLKTLFSKCGKVLGAKIVTNSKTPYSHFYGFVMMSSSEEATACVERLNHAELHGKILSVEKTMCDFGATMKKKVMHGENSVETVKKSSSEKINDSVTMEMEAQKFSNRGEISKPEKNAEELVDGETSGTAISKDDVLVESESKNSGEDKKEDTKLHKKELSKEKRIDERSRSRERYHSFDHRESRPRSRGQESRRIMEEYYRSRRDERYHYDRHHDSKYDDRRRHHRDHRHRQSPDRRNISRGFDREWEKLKLEELRLENERLELEREKQRIEHEKLKKEKEDLEKQIRERRAVKRPLEEEKHEDNYLDDRKLEVVPDFNDEEMHGRKKLVSQHPINRRTHEDFSEPEVHSSLSRGPHANENLRGHWKPLEMVEERHYQPRVPSGRNSPCMDEPPWNFERSSPWMSRPEDVRPPEGPGQWRPLIPRWEAPPQPEAPYVWLGRPRGPLLPFSAPPPMGHPMFGGPNRFF